MKDTWPPTKPTSVETIAASFVPPKNGSAVRLFNLAVDVKFASLQDGSGQTLASNVQYTLGSPWHPVPATQQTFTASSSTVAVATVVAATASEGGGGGHSGDSGKGGAAVQGVFGRDWVDAGTGAGASAEAGTLASAPFSPPAAPEAFTAFLMGCASFGYSLLPQIDAPEFGPCRPMS